MDLSDLVELNNTSYYQIINKRANKGLFIYQKSKDFEKQKVVLADPDQGDLSQVWMIVEVSHEKYPNMYEIVHTVSTLVLSLEKSNEMSLHFGKWKYGQLFFFQRYDPKNQPNHFLIKIEKNSNKYVRYTENGLCCSEIQQIDDSCVWELVLVHNNDVINRSCYIEYAYSNMVLDVPQANDNPGIHICQYPCNNRFNQRWNLIKCEEFKGSYKIQNLKTKLFLDIKGASKKQGEKIIQWKQNNGANQFWKIQYQGKNIYLLQSCLADKLFMSVKNNSLSQCADIVTTNDESQCFWRIVGYIPE